ncbi:iron complex transport system substrate-binding protein [Paenibacillus shirakamiensis]|uniref:Iron complex transport system substrate-binding protein n=1 Tax=Paenibacillus shirakamiensis TaxID=1265935 RepID=A0ABS4JMP4_9BACL|nr:ABC transporter substrate-binding protein [Paenibacillus shirakamiensis]MBP2002271.1 iron complex transport system substrate-binding protein [Paenibacillus shirakamiensis]
MTSKFKKPSLLLASILALSVLAACGNNNATPAESDSSKTTNNQNVTPSTPSSDSTTAVAVDETKAKELQAKFGDKKPEKVVVTSVAIAEMLDALGVVPVGVPTSKTALPAAFDSVTKIGSALKPDAEVISSLQPDVVLGPESIEDSLNKQLGASKLNLIYLPTDSLDDLKLSLVVLSRVYGQEAKATALINRLTQEETAAVKQAEGKTAPKVMFLFGSAESFMLMNESTFPGSLAKKLGATNIVSSVLKSKETYVPLDMESVVTANPDVILLVAHGDPEAAKKAFEADVKKNGAWEKMNAFKNNRVEALDYNLFGVASIVKAPDAYKEIASKLFPAN